MGRETQSFTARPTAQATGATSGCCVYRSYRAGQLCVCARTTSSGIASVPCGSQWTCFRSSPQTRDGSLPLFLSLSLVVSLIHSRSHSVSLSLSLTPSVSLSLCLTRFLCQLTRRPWASHLVVSLLLVRWLSDSSFSLILSHCLSISLVEYLSLSLDIPLTHLFISPPSHSISLTRIDLSPSHSIGPRCFRLSSVLSLLLLLSHSLIVSLQLLVLSLNTHSLNRSTVPSLE